MMAAWKTIASAAGQRVLFLLLALLLLGGCSSIKNAAKAVSDGVQDVTGSRSADSGDLMKKAVVVGLDPESPAAPAGFGAYFQSAISGSLDKECRNILFDPQFAASLKSPPRLPSSGMIDGYALAFLGRRQGVNAFVFGSLNDIHFLEEKKGFWLWKDTRYAVKVAVRLETYDVETAAKILDETLSEEMELDEVRYQQFRSGGRVRLDDLKTPLAVAVRKSAQRLCAILRLQPWRGFVTGGDPRKIAISSGLAAGLAPGRTLEVFGAGQVIEGKNGQRYVMPGVKIGEAVISSVSADGAEATLTDASEAAARPGATVRVKR